MVVGVNEWVQPGELQVKRGKETIEREENKATDKLFFISFLSIRMRRGEEKPSMVESDEREASKIRRREREREGEEEDERRVYEEEGEKKEQEDDDEVVSC